MTDNSIGLRLKEWIKESGKSQKEIAELLNTSQVVVSRLQSGVRRPGVDIQERLRALGADIDYIMTGRREVQSAQQKGELIAKYFIPNPSGIKQVVMESVIDTQGINISVYAVAKADYALHEVPVRKVAEPDAEEIETIYELNKPVQPSEKVAATAIIHKK